MKKITKLIFTFLFSAVLGLGLYIIVTWYQDNNDNLIINEDEEIILLNKELSNFSNPLGTIILTNTLDNSKEGDYNTIQTDINLLDSVSSKQLFTMEYILSYIDNYDKFIVLTIPALEVSNESNPTDDMTKAYLKYDEFNKYYKELFGKDFDNSKSLKGDTSYDRDYVYYQNRRSGLNGIYVPEMIATNVEYKKGVYTSSVKITYSTKTLTFLGKTEDYGTIKYRKNSDGKIILEWFSIN